MPYKTLAQLGLLLWKNVMLKKHRPLLTSMEILGPLIFYATLVTLRLVDKHSALYPTTFADQQKDSDVVVGYAPRSAATDLFMSNVETLLWKKGHFRQAKSFQILGFNSEYSMMEFVRRHPSFLLHAYTFEGMTNSSHSLPNHPHIFLRPSRSFSSFRTLTFNRSETEMLQVMMEAFINQVTGQENNITVYPRTFLGHANHLNEYLELRENVGHPLMVIMIFSCFLVLSNVYVIAQERQSGIVLLLVEMGMSPYVYWCSWYLTVFFYTGIVWLALAVILVTPVYDKTPILGYSEPVIIVLYFAVFTLPFTSFCLLGSVLHRHARTACAITGLVYISSCTTVLMLNLPGASFVIAQCLFIDINLVAFYMTAAEFERAGEGLQWHNLSKFVASSGTSVDTIITTLLTSIPVSLFLTWFVFNVRVLRIPIREILQQMFSAPKVQTSTSSATIQTSQSSFSAVEPGIALINVSATSPGKLTNVCLKMKEDTVTALTGFELSGKTTVMSLLRGQLKPTSGRIEVYNEDIVKDLDNIKRYLGICPRHLKVFFQLLTVQENINFFTRLKSYLQHEKHTAKFNVAQLVKNFQLDGVLDQKCWQLNPTTMRLLQVAIPFMGYNKVLLFEDPTLNMEPRTKRLVWNLIRKRMRGKTIVVCTDNLEEAEMTGDTIAIFLAGRLHCCGSFEFLKRYFGAGYRLTLTKDEECISSKIKQMIFTFISQARFEEETPSTLVFLLPTSATPMFHKLFSFIEGNPDYLKIKEFSVKACTIDEGVVGLSYKQDYASVRRWTQPSTRLAAEESSVSQTGDDITNGDVVIDSADERISSRIRLSGSPVDHPMQVDHSGENDNASSEEEVSDEASSIVPTIILTGWSLVPTHIRAMINKKIILNTCNFHIECIQGIALGLLAMLLCYPGDSGAEDVCKGSSISLGPGPIGASRPVVILAQGYPQNGNTDLLIRSYEEVIAKYAFDFHIIKFQETLKMKTVDYLSGNMSATSHMTYGATFYTPANSSNLTAVAWFKSDTEIAEILKAKSIIAVMNTFLYHISRSQHHYIHVTMQYQHDLQIEHCQMIDHFERQASRWAKYSSSMVSIALMMVPYFVALEIQTGSQHLQYLSGVHPAVFWGVHFFFDLLMFFFLSNFYFLIIVCFETEDVDEEFGMIYLITLWYGGIMHMYIYAVQNLFSSPSVAAATITLSNYFIGELEYLSPMLAHMQHLGDSVVGKILPPVIYPRAVHDMVAIGRQAAFCKYYIQYCDRPEHIMYRGYCCPEAVNCDEVPHGCHFQQHMPFQFHASVFLCHSCFWLLMLVLVEARVFRVIRIFCQRVLYKEMADRCAGEKAKIKLKQRVSRMSSTDERLRESPVRSRVGDLDGFTEHTEVSKEAVGTDGILLKQVEAFGSRTSTVSELSLWIPKGEIYCLVGTEASATSRVLSFLSCKKGYHSGQIYINGKPIKVTTRKPDFRIGYCPLFDAHLTEMTGRETLMMYASLKGIHKDSLEKEVDQMLKKFLLTNLANKPVYKYSECKQKRLSIAIALIGDPEIILLNDPIGKLDLISKDIFWKAISAIANKNKIIVMTYNNMEEIAERVTRMAVLIRGKLVCSGTPAFLRSTYCNSYTLMAKIDSLNTHISTKMLMYGLKERFPNAIMFCDMRYVNIHIPHEDEHVSDVFLVMESCKKHLKIEEYKLTNTNLNHVLSAFERSSQFDSDINDMMDDAEGTVEDLAEAVNKKSSDVSH